MIPIETSKIWAIGSIVSLTTNPLFSDDFPILISGEPLHISPLFVVIETILENETSYDSGTGDPITKKGSFQCKCLWFSTKSGQFETILLSSKLLKLIKEKDSKEEDDAKSKNKVPSIGSQVVLVTEYLESKKRKSSQLQKSEHNFKNNKTISPLLSFVSPVLQVIGTAKSESKEPLYDLKVNNRQKRWIPEILIKCKYFNSHSEKFSEILLPVEAIKIIETIKVDKLTSVKKLIDTQSRVILNANIDSSKKVKAPKSTFTFYRLSEIDYCSGIYSVKALNYLTNSYQDIIIDNNDNQFEEIRLNETILPKFGMSTDGLGLEITEITKTTLDGILDSTKSSKKESLVVIEYENIKGQLLKRSLTNCEIVPQNLIDKDGKPYQKHYLKADCHLRNDERFFLIDNIKSFIEYRKK